ncbi:MAG: YibE/F family protein [Gordonia sp. (in: high G+C Gram-positive bacteria)]
MSLDPYAKRHVGHSHTLSEIPAHLSPIAKRVVLATLALAAIAVAAGVVVLWPSAASHPIPTQFRSAEGGVIHTVKGEVVSQSRGPCLNQLVGTSQDSTDFGVNAQLHGPCIDSVVHIDSGNDSGKYTLLEVPTNRAQSGSGPDSVAPAAGTLDNPQAGQPDLDVGDHIRMSTIPGPDGDPRYTFFDFQRITPTLIWAVLFVAAVVLVAAWRGLRSIIGLVFAFVVLGAFTLPAILNGESPVAVAVVSSAAILFVVLYLAHGVNLRTSSALLGTLTSLVLAGVLSWLAIHTMHLTGLSGDQTINLQVYSGSISISGLLLAGFLIGTLGVLNDVTVTQASAAFELAAAGEPTRLATFRAAMRVGRDHIASTVYTLVFAYAGSALPLLLLFSVAQQPFGSLITTDAVAVELARSFVGGISIALSVPLTTLIAAALTRPADATNQPDRHSGRHSLPDHDR